MSPSAIADATSGAENAAERHGELADEDSVAGEGRSGVYEDLGAESLSSTFTLILRFPNAHPLEIRPFHATKPRRSA